MAFSERLKLEVKRKAAFRCCRCQEISIDIHHIIPRSQGGRDVLDNAAPLCQNCHRRFGHDPQKAKETREMRDWWYQRVSERFGSSPQFTQELSQLGNDIRGYILDNQKLFVNLSRRLTHSSLRPRLAHAPVLSKPGSSKVEKFITVDNVDDPDAFALEIRGVSMLPRFHSGDIVVVSPKARVKSGHPCIVKVDGQDTLKIIELEGSLVHLIPLNPEYEPLTVKRSSVEYIYKVVKLIADL